jgi:hypothetical protein
MFLSVLFCFEGDDCRFLRDVDNNITDLTVALKGIEYNLRSSTVFLFRALQLLATIKVIPSQLIPSTLMMEAICPPKRRLLQEPHYVTFQKKALFKKNEMQILMVLKVTDFTKSLETVVNTTLFQNLTCTFGQCRPEL